MIDDFITIEEAMKTGLISESYHEMFSNYTKCKACGSDVIINRNRTVMKCCNPSCYNVLTARILKVYNRFGLKNAGPKYVLEYILVNDIHTVPQALLKPPYEIHSIIEEWLEIPHSLGEILEMLTLPGVGSKSIKIMENFNSFKEFLQYIEIYGAKLVLFDCGIEGKIRFEWWKAVSTALASEYPWDKLSEHIMKSSKDGRPMPYETKEDFLNAIQVKGLHALLGNILGGEGKDGSNVAETMIIYWQEVLDMFDMCKAYPNKIENRKIVITGDITNVLKPNGSMYEREEFIAYVNTISMTYGVHYQNSHALASTEFIIADTPSNTAKYRAGLSRNKLITSDGFIKLIKERADNFGN